jgi:hypothetical protein
MELAGGTLICKADGDDISLPHRVERIYAAYEASNGGAMSLFSAYVSIDEEGKEVFNNFKPPTEEQYFSPKNLATKDFLLQGAVHVWHADVFGLFGKQITPLTCEDRVIPFRSALLGGIRYVPEVLVKMRRHSTNFWMDDRVVNPLQSVEEKWERQVSFRKQYFFDLRSVYENRLKDLAVVAARWPERKGEIEELEGITRQALEKAQFEIDLYNSRWARRAAGLARSALRGSDLRTLRQGVGIHLLPSLYKRYMCRKHRRNQVGLRLAPSPTIR